MVTLSECCFNPEVIFVSYIDLEAGDCTIDDARQEIVGNIQRILHVQGRSEPAASIAAIVALPARQRECPAGIWQTLAMLDIPGQPILDKAALVGGCARLRDSRGAPIRDELLRQ